MLNGIDDNRKKAIKNYARFLFEPRDIHVSFTDNFVNIYDEETNEIIGNLFVTDKDNVTKYTEQKELFGSNAEIGKHKAEMKELARYIKTLRPSNNLSQIKKQSTLFGLSDAPLGNRFFLLKQKAGNKYGEVFDFARNLLGIKEKEEKKYEGKFNILFEHLSENEDYKSYLKRAVRQMVIRLENKGFSINKQDVEKVNNDVLSANSFNESLQIFDDYFFQFPINIKVMWTAEGDTYNQKEKLKLNGFKWDGGDWITYEKPNKDISGVTYKKSGYVEITKDLIKEAKYKDIWNDEKIKKVWVARGDTFPVKERLKKQGFKWNGKDWISEVQPKEKIGGIIFKYFPMDSSYSLMYDYENVDERIAGLSDAPLGNRFFLLQIKANGRYENVFKFARKLVNIETNKDKRIIIFKLQSFLKHYINRVEKLKKPYYNDGDIPVKFIFDSYFYAAKYLRLLDYKTIENICIKPLIKHIYTNYKSLYIGELNNKKYIASYLMIHKYLEFKKETENLINRQYEGKFPDKRLDFFEYIKINYDELVDDNIIDDYNLFGLSDAPLGNRFFLLKQKAGNKYGEVFDFARNLLGIKEKEEKKTPELPKEKKNKDDSLTKEELTELVELITVGDTNKNLNEKFGDVYTFKKEYARKFRNTNSSIVVFYFIVPLYKFLQYKYHLFEIMGENDQFFFGYDQNKSIFKNKTNYVNADIILSILISVAQEILEEQYPNINYNITKNFHLIYDYIVGVGEKYIDEIKTNSNSLFGLSDAPLENRFFLLKQKAGNKYGNVFYFIKANFIVQEQESKELFFNEKETEKPEENEEIPEIIEHDAEKVSKIKLKDDVITLYRPSKHYDDTEYFNQSWRYFAEQYSKSQSEIQSKEVERIDNEIEKIKGIRDAAVANQREMLKSKLSQAKDRLNKLKRIQFAQWSEINDNDKTSIYSLISASNKANGGNLPDDIRKYRINYLMRLHKINKPYEFFPTPDSNEFGYDIAGRMVDELQLEDGMRILEPSAGDGNLIEKIYEKGFSKCEIEAVELNPTNREVLNLKGFKLIGSDFMVLDPKARDQYDRIIMNPPFDSKDLTDIKHVKHALKFLRPGGILVGISSEHSVSNASTSTTGFRMLIEKNGKFIEYPRGIWKNAERPATVEPVLFVIVKTAEMEEETKVQVITFKDAKVGQYLEDENFRNTKYGVWQIRNKDEKEKLLSVESLECKTIVDYRMADDGLQNLPLKFRAIDDSEAARILKTNDDSHSKFRIGANGKLQIPIIPPVNEDLKPVNLITARSIYTQTAKNSYIDGKIATILNKHQIEGVNLALDSLNKYNCFLNADGTGSGKTMQELAIADYYVRTKQKPVLIISISEDVLRQAFIGDAKKLGIARKCEVLNNLNDPFYLAKTMQPKIYLAKYTDLIGFNRNSPELSKLTSLKAKWQLKKQEYARKKKDIENLYKNGRVSKKESQDLKKLVDDDILNDPLQRELIVVEDGYLKLEKDAFSTLAKELSVVIYDECHKLKNYIDENLDSGIISRRGEILADNCENKVLFSATPADRPETLFYLKLIKAFLDKEDMHNQLISLGFNYKEPKYNDKGELIKRERYTLPKEFDRTSADSGIENLFNDVTEDGRMLKRELELVNMRVQVKYVSVPEKAISVIKKIADTLEAREDSKSSATNIEAEQRRALEPYKIADTIAIAEQELAEGRSVAIYCSLKDEDNEKVKDWGDVKTGTIKQLHDYFACRFGENAIGLLVGADDDKARKKRLQDVADFQMGKKRIMLSTIQTGATGISLDDQDIFESDEYDDDGKLLKRGRLVKQGGDIPRTIIIMSAPMSAEENVQVLGRIYRKNTKTIAKAFYLFVPEIAIEMHLESIIEAKLSLLNAVVGGEVKKFRLSQIKSEQDIDITKVKIKEQLIQQKLSEDSKKTNYYHKLYKECFKDDWLDGNSLPTKVPIKVKVAKIERYGSLNGVEIQIKGNNREQLLNFQKQHSDLLGDFQTKSSRYEGTMLFKEFNKVTSQAKYNSDDDFRNTWNSVLNLLIKEKSNKLYSTNQIYKENERVYLTEDDRVNHLRAGEKGTIISARKRPLSWILTEENQDVKQIFSYKYDIQFDNGIFGKRIDQDVLAPLTVKKYSRAEMIEREWERIEEKFTVTNQYRKDKGYDNYLLKPVKNEYNNSILLYLSSNTPGIEKEYTNWAYPSEAGAYLINTDEYVVTRHWENSPHSKEIQHYAEQLAQDFLSFVDNLIEVDYEKRIMEINKGGRVENAQNLSGVGRNLCAKKMERKMPPKLTAKPKQLSEVVKENEVKEIEPKNNMVNSNKPMTRSELILVKPNLIKLEGKHAILFNGRLSKPFSMLIWGEPGSGKSSYALMLANNLAKDGKVLYFTSEEKISSGRISERVRNFHIDDKNIYYCDDGRFEYLIELLNNKQYDFKYVIIDSINTINKDSTEVLEMIREFQDDGISFISISHALKGGKNYKGVAEVNHLIDTEIRVDKDTQIATTLKHRDSIIGGEIKVFDNEEIEEEAKYKYKKKDPLKFYNIRF